MHHLVQAPQLPRSCLVWKAGTASHRCLIKQQTTSYQTSLTRMQTSSSRMLSLRQTDQMMMVMQPKIATQNLFCMLSNPDGISSHVVQALCFPAAPCVNTG